MERKIQEATEQAANNAAELLRGLLTPIKKDGIDMNNTLTALECVQVVIDDLSVRYCNELSKAARDKNGSRFGAFSTEAGEKLAKFSQEDILLPPRVVVYLLGYLMTMNNDEYYRKLMCQGDTQKLKEILADHTFKSHDLLNIALLMKAAREMRL